METSIIAVKYEDYRYPKTFSGKAYTYYTTFDVEVGDFVIAPTQYGERIAIVTRINIPVYKIQIIRPYLKFISAKISKLEYLVNDNIVEIEDVA